MQEPVSPDASRALLDQPGTHRLVHGIGDVVGRAVEDTSDDVDIDVDPADGGGIQHVARGVWESGQTLAEDIGDPFRCSQLGDQPLQCGRVVHRPRRRHRVELTQRFAYEERVAVGASTERGCQRVARRGRLDVPCAAQQLADVAVAQAVQRDAPDPSILAAQLREQLTDVAAVVQRRAARHHDLHAGHVDQAGEQHERGAAGPLDVVEQHQHAARPGLADAGRRRGEQPAAVDIPPGGHVPHHVRAAAGHVRDQAVQRAGGGHVDLGDEVVGRTLDEPAQRTEQRLVRVDDLQSPPEQDHATVALHFGRELGCQAGLADPHLAGEQGHIIRAAPPFAQFVQLGVTTDECRPRRRRRQAGGWGAASASNRVTVPASDGSCVLIRRSSAMRSGPGMRPISSSADRARWNARSASAWRPLRCNASMSRPQRRSRSG